MYVIELTLTGDMRCDAYIDAESGLIVKEELELLGQGPGAIMTTIMYDDHQLIDGVLLPRQITMSNDVTGSMIVKIERVETNLELPADEFVLKPRH